jgi:hypothetical protein
MISEIAASLLLPSSVRKRERKGGKRRGEKERGKRKAEEKGERERKGSTLLGSYTISSPHIKS